MSRLTSRCSTLFAGLLVAVFTVGCGDDDPVSNAGTVDVVDTAVAAGSFDTLVSAVQAAGLVSTLKGPGPFTVFAPTDAAFDALPDGTLESLLAPSGLSSLQSILTYHVVPGRVSAADVVNLTSASTVNGEAITISVENGQVKINDATVIQTDIEASNGIIHVIDAVILPPS